jgi:hypothetical protein
VKEPAFPFAVRLLEDALALVKRADSKAWAIYLFGVVPFFALLLFEVTDLVQNPFVGEHLMLMGFGLAALYFWLHVSQSVFCAYLHGALTERGISWKEQFSSAASSQFILAGSKLVLWPVALILVIPHAAITMFYQHSLLAAEESGNRDWRATLAESKRDAVYRQSQTIWMLILILLLRALLCINLFVLLFVLPQLWKILTGMESNVTRAPAVLLNPTSLTALCILAYLGLDPIVKAACVLRRFARQSETSGQDLRLKVATLHRLTVLVLFVGFLCAPVRASVSAEQMTTAIHNVFRDPANTWNLPAVEHPKRAASGFEAFLDSIVSRIGKTWSDAKSAVRSLLERLRRIFSSESNPAHRKQPPMSTGEAWILMGTFFGLLAVSLLFSFWNRRKRPKLQVVTATTDVAMPMTCIPEDVEAASQTEDRWLSLAQQYRASGDFRLALRALYLSNLAILARENIITLARGKSNLDYLREVQRRAKRLGREVSNAFQANVQLFERSWYGAYPASEEALDLFLRNSSTLQESLV